jgi:hypothetical protein
MANTVKKTAAKSAAQKTANEAGMTLTRSNYKLMLIGLGVIILGLILMAGPTPDPEVFDWSMCSFRRITLAPILILAGFGFEIYAIMKRTK